MINSDLYLTEHFVRAWYYYARGNGIWHIHLARASKRLVNIQLFWECRLLLDEYPDVSEDRPNLCDTKWEDFTKFANEKLGSYTWEQNEAHL